MKITGKPKPFVKWAGGKQALAPALMDRFPQSFERYYEPFVGGGSILLQIRPGCHGVAGDLNGWLLDTYVALRDDWKQVAEKLDTLPNTKEDFLRIRKIQPATLDGFTRAAHFIYLNKTCFRGLFRVNRRGEFNVPYGAYDRRYYSPENLSSVSAALKNIDFRLGDFELCLHDVSAGGSK